MFSVVLKIRLFIFGCKHERLFSTWIMDFPFGSHIFNYYFFCLAHFWIPFMIAFLFDVLSFPWTPIYYLFFLTFFFQFNIPFFHLSLSFDFFYIFMPFGFLSWCNYFPLLSLSFSFSFTLRFCFIFFPIFFFKSLLFFFASSPTLLRKLSKYSFFFSNLFSYFLLSVTKSDHICLPKEKQFIRWHKKIKKIIKRWIEIIDQL